MVVDQALESYVRTDIPCGSSRCSYCTATAPTLSAEASHYVLPDTTALAELLELFELPEMQHLLLLTSIVAKVRSQASPKCRTIYGWASDACRAQASLIDAADAQRHTLQVSQTGNMRQTARLRKLYADRRRSCTLFDNLHCKYTAPEPHRSAGCLPLVHRRSAM